MKVLIALLALTAVSCALNIDHVSIDIDNPVYGYLTRFGIPEAERIRKAEEEAMRRGSKIVGGAPAEIANNPWQAGLLINIVGATGNAICGASLITQQKLVTAAHCYFDGTNQGELITVVLGSNALFYGGERIQTNNVVLHPEWLPSLVRNDVGVITLPHAVATSNVIRPIALPSGSDLSNTFNGATARASGFGLTSDNGGISTSQVLSEVELSVISNTLCSLSFPVLVRSSNICTRGTGGVGTCRGDSGGPLVTNTGSSPILIGITSFGSAMGCEAGMPAVYARVTAYMDFINSNL